MNLQQLKATAKEYDKIIKANNDKEHTKLCKSVLRTIIKPKIKALSK